MAKENLNQGNWGVCGFVAALQAAASNNLALGQEYTDIFKDSINNLRQVTQTKDHYPLLLKYIVRFVEELSRSPLDSKDELKTEIMKFTESFGADYKVEKFIDFKQKFEKELKELADGKPNSPTGMALTPKAMDYLLANTLMMGSKTPRIRYIENGFNRLENIQTGNRILGLCAPNENPSKDNYFHLRHWVFIDHDKKVYSWGEKYEPTDQDLKRYIGYKYFFDFN